MLQLKFFPWASVSLLMSIIQSKVLHSLFLVTRVVKQSRFWSAQSTAQKRLSLSDCSPSLFSKRIRFPLNSQIRLSTQECPILLQSLKERTLIPHPSSNGFRTRIYFEVTQHQEFITSFWNVGENGHSNKTAKGLQYQKQQLPLPSHRMETWSGHSFTAPHRMVL